MLRFLKRGGKARLACAATLALALTGAHPAAAADTALIFAAASTREAVLAVADLARQRLGVTVKASFAGSSSLARQIESGAPADLFLSANTAWMDRLQDAGLIDAGSRRDLVRNRIVLIAPAGAPPAGLPDPLTADSGLDAALHGGRLAIAEPDSVPAGIYAKQALTSLGLWQAVSGHLAPAADVRATLALVERGEAPLGVVYATDARASTGVSVVSRIPPTAHRPIVYPIALTEAGARNPAAARVLALFLSPDAGDAFAARGFEPIAP